MINRTAGFAAEIDKSAPAGNAFNQRKTALDRFAFQTWHRESPALRAVGIGDDVHAVQALRHDLIAVVIGRGLGLIEVKTGGENAFIALLRHLAQRVLPLPGLDQNAFRQIRMIDLIPADHLAMVFLKNGFQFAVEIGLQRMAVRQFVVAHKLLDGGAVFPLAIVNFITADMQIRIGEDRCQFADHRVGKGVSRLFCWIENGFQHAPVALHFIRAWCAHQFRIGHGDRRRMARHVNFGNHANTPRGGVTHHVAHLLRCVEQPVAGELGQFRIALRGKPPALIVRQMPVQDV
ncbi:hypothetical protein D3C72_1190250 [compost metagenome]